MKIRKSTCTEIPWTRLRCGQRVFRFALLLFCATLCFPCDPPTEFGTAKRLLAGKNDNDAAVVLDRLKNCPLSPHQLFELGWFYGRARRFEDALAAFQSVPDDVPDAAGHRYAVGLSQFELGRYKAVVETLTKTHSEEAIDAQSANLLAVSYSKLGLYEQAQATLMQEIERHADDEPAYLNLATLYADQDRFADAAQIASTAVKLFPRSAEMWIVSGAAKILIGRLGEAYQDFSRAVDLTPDVANPRFFLALTQYKQGRFQEAIESLQRANQRGIADSDLHYLLAECLLKGTDTNSGAALRELNRAIELDRNSVPARALRGKLLLEAGRTSDAIVDLEQAHQRDPSSRTACYQLARAYQQVGRIRESKLLFEQLRNNKSDSIAELSERRLTQVFTSPGTQP